MRSRWVFGIYCALVVFIAGCTAESADTIQGDTTATASTVTTTTILSETTTTLAVQDPDEAVDVARELLEAVMVENQTAIVELVEVPDEMNHTTNQIRNVFRFAVATGWLDEVGDCGVDESHSESSVVVMCAVFSWHPLFGFPDEERGWSLQVQDGAVVGADPAFFSTEGAEELLAWLGGERSTVAELMCGSDAYDSSEAVAEVFPVHPRCGSYVTEQMGRYFASTEPDHPVAVWHQFSEAWNDRRLNEVLSLFAEDALLDTGDFMGRLEGRDDIREFVEFEFENFPDSLTYFEDFEVDGSTLRMISSWTTNTGQRVGFRPDFAVVEDGLIQSLEFGDDDNV